MSRRVPLNFEEIHEEIKEKNRKNDNKIVEILKKGYTTTQQEYINTHPDDIIHRRAKLAKLAMEQNALMENKDDDLTDEEIDNLLDGQEDDTDDETYDGDYNPHAYYDDIPLPDGFSNWTNPAKNSWLKKHGYI